MPRRNEDIWAASIMLEHCGRTWEYNPHAWQTGNMAEPLLEVNDTHRGDSSSSESEDLFTLYWSNCKAPSELSQKRKVSFINLQYTGTRHFSPQTFFRTETYLLI